MDYSAANTSLWSFVLQLGLIALLILVSNILRHKIPFIRKTMMPTAVLAGFLLLLLRSSGLLHVNTEILEMLTYHGIAIGFIALSLRVKHNDKNMNSSSWVAGKSGALIVSTYLFQGIIGLIIALVLFYTIMPDFFAASGLLLPLAYGQGPGQANNFGSVYEGLGFAGGHSFALSLAASGFLCACIIGVFYLNYLSRKGIISRSSLNNTSDGDITTIDVFQDNNEMPISESIDKLSIQVSLVLFVYVITYLVLRFITGIFNQYLPGLSGTVSPLLWGFNFIFGSAFALIVCKICSHLRKTGVMRKQYQNNYLLSRISGLAFDVMIVAGIGIINISDLQGLWIPFLLMAVSGGILTLFYLRWLCRRLYPNYYYEALLSMYGMLTGTISSGVILLREIDPQFNTPAADNLLTGSVFGIMFGAPMMILLGICPNSLSMTWLTLGLVIVYLLLLLLFIFKIKTAKPTE